MKFFTIFAAAAMMAATAMAQSREVTVITELGDAVDKVELYAGPELYTGSWSNYPKAEFKESVAAGNVINVHVRGDEGASGQCLQSLYKSDEGTVDHLCIGNNEWRCAGVPAGESVVSYTIASPEEADAINAFGGWVFGGDKVTITSIWIAKAGPVTLAGWNGHRYAFPEVRVGDEIAHAVTGLGGGNIKTYAKDASDTELCLLDNDTGWNCVGVADGEQVLVYTVKTQEEADAINHYGYGVCGENAVLTSITLTPSECLTGMSLPSSLFSQEPSSLIHDLQGRRANASARGFYIVEGKKIIR